MRAFPPCCPRTTTIRTAPARGGRNPSSTTRPTSTSSGEIPDDLDGVYLRNTENPVHRVDRPLPPVRRRRHAPHDPLPRRPRRATATASCAPHGLDAEQEAGGPLWAGIARAAGAVAARRRLGRARAHEGRVEHRRRRARRPRAHLLLPVRRPLRARPATLEQLGPRRLGRPLPAPTGVSAHTKVDEHTGEMLVLQLRQDRAVHALRRRRRRRRARALRSTSRCPARACRTTWRSPSTTRSSTTARCSGTPTLLAQGRATCRASTPSCRRASRSSRAAAAAPTIRWFEADPTYVLHWVNAYEDGDEIVLDGFFQDDPRPARDGATGSLYERMFRYLDARPHADRARTAGASTWRPAQTQARRRSPTASWSSA